MMSHKTKMPRILSTFALLVSMSLIVFIGCKSNNSSSVQNQKTTTYYSFLDSIDASKEIVKDRYDGFFTHISTVDMAIQMRTNTFINDRSQSLKEYRALLESEVSNFTNEEMSELSNIFDQIEHEVSILNTKLLPNIRIGKIKTNHYGPDVFYTRDNIIFIPENVLEKNAFPNLKNVMYHEIFHILSRIYPEVKEKTYALIGFKPLSNKVGLPKALQETLLTNPDGAEIKYFITLVDDAGNKIEAIPLITSTKKNYQNGNNSLFNYLEFDLFEYDRDSRQVLCTEQGKTSIPGSFMASFFEQIKDNTQYIIHPDEILADNFMMSFTVYGSDTFDELTPDGQKLIIDLREILRTHISK